MTDRYANGDPSNDRGGLDRRPLASPASTRRHGLLPRRRPQGADRRLHGPDARPRADQEPRLQRDLDHAAVRPGDGAGRQRRLPRLLDHRLHLGRPAPRHGRRTSAPSSSCAHSLGLKVILDVVVNHTGDVILLGGTPTSARSRFRTATATGKPFVPARYATGKTFPCLSAKYMPRRPSCSRAGPARRRSPPG